jgi:hypothetical protein
VVEALEVGGIHIEFAPSCGNERHPTSGKTQIANFSELLKIGRNDQEKVKKRQITSLTEIGAF